MADEIEDLTEKVKKVWRRVDVTVIGKFVGTVDGRLDEESMDRLLDAFRIHDLKVVRE